MEIPLCRKIRDFQPTRVGYEIEIYSCGGFNTPTLCVVTKGIKAECNHLMRTTYPDACVGVVDYRHFANSGKISKVENEKT